MFLSPKEATCEQQHRETSMTMKNCFSPPSAAFVLVLLAATLLGFQAGAFAEQPVSGGVAAGDPGPGHRIAAVEIRIKVDDATQFRGLPAWQRQEFESGVEWSVRHDLFDLRSRGLIFIEVHDDNTSRAVAVVPFPADDFTAVLPLAADDLDPERRAALLDLNEMLPSLALRRTEAQLFIAECGSEDFHDDSCEFIATEQLRVIRPGDTLRSPQWPGVEIVFHPPVERLLAFRIFVDYAPPADD